MAEPARSGDTVHRKILVLNVDDYEAGRYATSRVLRQAGFDVLEAATGNEALEATLREHPDLVLLDVNLPDVHGFEVCRRIKANPRTAAMPVLYLSAAYRSADHRVTGLDLGADGYLTQPVEPRELVATVNALLRAREVDEAVRRSEERFRALVAGTSDLIWTAAPDGAVEGGDGWIAYTGQAGAGDAWLLAVHPEDRERVRAAWAQAVAAGTRYRDEHRLRRGDGEYRDVIATAVPVLGADGAVREWVGSIVDVTEQRRQEEWQRVLGDAGALLAGSMDAESGLPAVAAAALGPLLAAWAAIDLCDDEGVPHRAAFAAAESLPPAAREALDAAIDAESCGAAEVARARRARHEVPAAGSALAAAGIRSLAVAPLVARGQAVGAVTLAAADSMAAYGEGDLAQLTELGRRIALALDNGRLYQAALTANAAKGQFLAVMSHELRTPLNAIIGYADLLDAGVAGDLNPAQREHLNRVRAGSKHLLRLIEDVLLFSRLEVGRETVYAEEVELGALLRESAALVEPLAAQKGLALRVETPDEPLVATTDQGKVHQIVLNLLSNSVKFTDAGEIHATLARGDGVAVITVADTGIGIAMEHRERIFDVFRQVEQAPTRRVGGTGLGLSVTRNLARLLGGDVTVESRFPGGSIFTVRIPLVLPPVDVPPVAPELAS
ncbi:MAG TPA: ATP-binding protein [Longimicrobium sp.]|nr:ATP-binding protein [Longimicrobium sp.]